MVWFNLGQLQSRTPNGPFYSGTNSRTPHDPLYSRTNAKQRMILYIVEPMQDHLPHHPSLHDYCPCIRRLGQV